jgi:hypothetical protein
MVSRKSEVKDFGIIAVKKMTGEASKIPHAGKDAGDPERI